MTRERFVGKIGPEESPMVVYSEWLDDSDELLSEKAAILKEKGWRELALQPEEVGNDD